MRQQLRVVLVGQARVGLHGGTAGFIPQTLEARAIERGVVGGQHRLQRPVDAPQVHVGQRRALVDDLVGGAHA